MEMGCAPSLDGKNPVSCCMETANVPSARHSARMLSAWNIVRHGQEYMLVGSRGLYTYTGYLYLYIKGYYRSLLQLIPVFKKKLNCILHLIWVLFKCNNIFAVFYVLSLCRYFQCWDCCCDHLMIIQPLVFMLVFYLIYASLHKFSISNW